MCATQAASGAGAPGMDELIEETKKYVNTGEMPANKVFAHPLPLNVIPHIDVFQVTWPDEAESWQMTSSMFFSSLLHAAFNAKACCLGLVRSRRWACVVYGS